MGCSRSRVSDEVPCEFVGSLSHLDDQDCERTFGFCLSSKRDFTEGFRIAGFRPKLLNPKPGV